MLPFLRETRTSAVTYNTYTFNNRNGDETDILASTRQMFCTRCYIFDCSIHGTDAMPRRPFSKKMKYTIKGSSECGKFCANSKGLSSTMKFSEWTLTDRKMLARLLLVFGTDFCSIATIMYPKKCAEIKRYRAEKKQWFCEKIKRLQEKNQEDNQSRGENKSSYLFRYAPVII